MRTIGFTAFLLTLVACASSEPIPDKSSVNTGRGGPITTIPADATSTVTTTATPLTFAAARHALIRLAKKADGRPLSLTVERLEQTGDVDVSEGEVVMARWRCDLTKRRFAILMSGRGVCSYSGSGDFVPDPTYGWTATITEESWAKPDR